MTADSQHARSTRSSTNSSNLLGRHWRSLSAPQYVKTIYNALFKSAPVSVVVFGGLVLIIGVFVLIHTQHLVATAAFRPSDLDTSIVKPFAAQIPADSTNCTELWIDQRIDHFSWLEQDVVNLFEVSTSHKGLPATFKQRYLLNTQFWDRTDVKAPIFFYTGNEGDVTLYANHTGLIWENAQTFKALVVFAEHRYYGKSFPFGNKYMKHLEYLTHEQALADYAELIYHLQNKYDAMNHPVIAFGGSYGGMLSAWFRMKYPSIVAGAIAASAPIYGFGGFRDFDGQKYWQVVTQDASPSGGSARNCVPNARKAWPMIFNLAKTMSGRTRLSSIFRVCEPLTTEKQGEELAMSLLFAFDTLAMGNFPYSSNYLTGGTVSLPAWPVREACSHLAADFGEHQDVNTLLLEALRDAANVYYNASKDMTCFRVPMRWDYDGIWDYQYCTEMLPQETYFNTNGETDMFWPRNNTFEKIIAHCQREWQTTPDPNAIRISYGDELLRSTSNIVFSNGLLDPWSSAGVLHVPKNAKVTIVQIAEGAHHLDLFFSHPKDPISVITARKTEINMIRQWIDEFAAYQ